MKEKKIILQISKDSDASYIYLRESLTDLKPGEAKRQIIIDGFDADEEKKFRAEIILDIDEKGKLFGIEILGDVLPDNLK